MTVSLKNQSKPRRMLSYAIPHDIVEPRRSTMKLMARDPSTGDIKQRVAEVATAASLHIPHGATVDVDDSYLLVAEIARDIEARDLTVVEARAPSAARVEQPPAVPDVDAPPLVDAPVVKDRKRKGGKD